VEPLALQLPAFILQLHCNHKANSKLLAVLTNSNFQLRETFARQTLHDLMSKANERVCQKTCLVVKKAGYG